MNANVRLSRGTITSRGSEDSLLIFHRMHSDPIYRLETVQSHFQAEDEN